MAKSLTSKPLAALFEVLQVAIATVDLLEPLPDSEERTHHLETLCDLVERYAAELDRRDKMMDLVRGFGPTPA